jgi:hypothetical protein
MTGSIDGVRAKIARARHHLDEVEHHCIALLGAYEGATQTDYDHDEGEYVVSMRTVPAVPLDLPLALGDALHNLRSALDHLAGALITHAGGTPTPNTYFPICKVKPTAGHRGGNGSGLPNTQPSFSNDVRKVLHELQPYRRRLPTHHPLAVLHELNIRDKHRDLLVAVVGAYEALLMGPVFVDVTHFDAGPYEVGQEVLRYRWEQFRGLREAKPQVHVVKVVLLEPDMPPAQVESSPADFVRLTALRYIQHEVMPRLAPFC